ncbi:hypothetical protein L228DRAFT_51552 [Xylona heveae TC161]|uniref:Uncharacterized protein n=1 Tax=Xylona heveae (strain CBS 132557 / TC161) TaxID=1328760 RepID=A0A164ZDK8_XYLHT|nr:hypothetical protein L228DRAFT_51552 [Xylona heveae TC161]KZF18965.1 hypothetical protein L228DRAFT_51552 [Xylona heveae TC161]
MPSLALSRSSNGDMSHSNTSNNTGIAGVGVNSPQIFTNNIWVQMGYTPPRGPCTHKASLIAPGCPCLRFMIHPTKAATSFECDGCGHHASYHQLENKKEDEILARWRAEEASANDRHPITGRKRRRTQRGTGNNTGQVDAPNGGAAGRGAAERGHGFQMPGHLGNSFDSEDPASMTEQVHVLDSDSSETEEDGRLIEGGVGRHSQSQMASIPGTTLRVPDRNTILQSLRSRRSRILSSSG